MTFRELKAEAKAKGATYVCELNESTRVELLAMQQTIFDAMPWWDKEDIVEDLESDLLKSKVTDLDELFKLYKEYTEA